MKEGKKMDNKKTYGIIGVAVLVLVVVAVVSIAYAGFTQNLTINGQATVVASSWKVVFSDLQEKVVTGTAEEISAPTITSNDTHIGDYAVEFTTPGDSISYDFKVKNDGSFDAKVSSINLNTPSCLGSGQSASTDQDNVCQNLEYKLTYKGGGQINVGDKITSGGSKDLTLTLTYKSDLTADKLPKSDVTISNLDGTLSFQQDESAGA